MNSLSLSATNTLKVVLLGAGLCLLPIWKTGCHLALISYLIVWVVEGNWRSKVLALRQDSFAKSVVILSFIIIIGLLYTEDWTSEKFPLTKKVFLILLPFAIVTSNYQLTKQDFRSIFIAFTTVCLGLVVVAFGLSIVKYQQFVNGNTAMQPGFLPEHLADSSAFWSFTTYTSLGRSVQLHPTYFSVYLATSVIFLLTDLSARRNRILKIFIILLFCCFIVLLSSRIVMIAMSLLLVLRCAYAVLESARVALMIASLLLCSIVLASFNPVSRHRGWDEIRSTSLAVSSKKLYRNSTEIRASQWYLGWQACLEVNPLIGSGTGDVSQEMKAQRDKTHITNVLDNYDPHNQYLHFMIAHGVLGLVTLTSVFILGIIRGFRDRNFMLAGFAILVSLVCVTESMLEVQKGIVLFALVMPMLFVKNKEKNLIAVTTA